KEKKDMVGCRLPRFLLWWISSARGGPKQRLSLTPAWVCPKDEGNRSIFISSRLRYLNQTLPLNSVCFYGVPKSSNERVFNFTRKQGCVPSGGRTYSDR